MRESLSVGAVKIVAFVDAVAAAAAAALRAACRNVDFYAREDQPNEWRSHAIRCKWLIRLQFQSALASETWPASHSGRRCT